MQKMVVFHGTNGRFNKFEQSKARIQNDLYGGGVAYFTDSIEIAKQYASSMARRGGGDKIIYETALKFNKLFDVDKNYTGDELVKMINGEYEQFARGSKLLRLGDDRSQIIASLKSGSAVLNGDQVFRGMSNGMVQTKKARERLITLGFDGLRYNGGIQMGDNRHNVYLAYKATQVEILSRMIVTNKPVPSSEKQDAYVFIN